MEGREHIGQPIVSVFFISIKTTLLIKCNRQSVDLHELLLVISNDVLKLLLMHLVVVSTLSLPLLISI